jgi:ABC-2 type transport system ATP-binding protein
MSAILYTMSNNEDAVTESLEPVVSAQALKKSFGEVDAVRSISFDVGAGEVVGILGPNGAGKTTTINMATTLLKMDGGQASIGGFDVETEPEVVRQLFGVAGQSAAVDEKLTARENLELFARLYKIPRAERKDRIAGLIDRFGLDEIADRPASTYSGGERRRLDLVAALVAEPPVVFLDEPTTGLDPRARTELWNTVRELASDGTAIVLTTQYLEEADQLADRILLIDKGTIVAQGTPDELKRNLERDVLELQFETDVDMAAAVRVLETSGPFTVNRPSRTVDVPVSDGAVRSMGLLRELEDAGIEVSYFQLRRPTLDDVFLSLTGITKNTDEASK